MPCSLRCLPFITVLTSCVALFAAASNVQAADDLIRITPAQAKKAGVVTAALAETKASMELRLPAQVVVPPNQMEVVTAATAGMVTAVRVAYGEAVKKGQVLAVMRGSQLLELQRDFGTARAQAELAAENLHRDEALFADGIIAGSRLSATRHAERQAALQLAERRQALQMAGAAAPGGQSSNLSGTAEIRAPFAGVILEATVQPGQRVDGMTPLFKLGRMAPLWLELQATPAQAADIQLGDKVKVLPNCAEAGQVTLIAPAMQSTNQSLLIRAELAKPEGCVMPFQYVQTQILLAHQGATGTWRLPPAALAHREGKSWVFQLVPEGFQPLEARVMVESPNAAIVSVDLPEDARVAIRGVSALKAIWMGLGAGEEK